MSNLFPIKSLGLMGILRDLVIRGVFCLIALQREVLEVEAIV